jgi:inosose dehydratase
MTDLLSRFHFACAPDSWGVLDYPGPSWNQPYETMLDEMAEAGYTGSELGPYGFFPTDPAVLKPQLEKRNLKLLGSFVPVVLSDPASAGVAVEHIRKVGDLLSTLKAPFLVLADAQSDERNRISGRVPRGGGAGLTPAQWKNVAKVVEEAAKVSADFGLDLVFHPHVATYVETPEECERFFDVTSHTGIGLCLDTGHCEYGGGDSVTEASKFASVLRFLHIKDVDNKVLEGARRKKLNFEQAIEEKVFTIIGQGSIDFPGLFRLLDKNNYSGWMVIEQDVKFGATVIPPAESVAASLRYLHGVMRDLATALER